MWQRISMCIVLCGVIVGCGSTPAPVELTPFATPDSAEVGIDVVVADATATVGEAPATPTIFTLPTATPSNADAPDATAIVATIQAALPATPTPDASGLTSSSVLDTAVVNVWKDDNGPYFAAITTGMMDDIDAPHPLNIYQKRGDTFVLVTHYDYVGGEYIDGIELIPNVDAQKAFFVVNGGIGAHSSFGTVFSFDGKTLKVEVEGHSDAGGGAVTIKDINNDGVPDVVADATDYYVFCYACGVRIWNNTVYAWDGTAFVEQKIQPASDAATNTIVAYAQAQRWNKVDALLAQLTPPSMAPDKWNIALMRNAAQLRKPASDEPFPLLAQIFYGDYDAAVALLKAIGAKETADFNGKWFAGPIADGQDVPSTADFRQIAAENMIAFADLALAQDPKDTSVLFIRGWARTLISPRDPAGIADLQAVAGVDPFYAAVRDAVVGR